jgi:hypothetical protein
VWVPGFDCPYDAVVALVQTGQLTEVEALDPRNITQALARIVANIGCEKSYCDRHVVARHDPERR